MLEQMAVADAYGIGFEFVPNTPDRPNDLSQYYQHPKYADMVPGCYTDDTQRSLANAFAIMGGGMHSGAAYDPSVYARCYLHTFKRDPRPGYSKRYEAYLRECVAGGINELKFMQGLQPRFTNGACMGAAVLGYLPTVRAVGMAAGAQAMATHSAATVPYAQLVAWAAHYFIYKVGHKADLAYWLAAQVAEYPGLAEWVHAQAERGQNWSRYCQPVDMKASSVVSFMLAALPNYNSLQGLIHAAVEAGGDADSTAAVLVAVASCSSEYVDDLPQVLRAGLENGEFGREYLLGIDAQLARLPDFYKEVS
jgi:ADP-ribosyl-[dinitrogen reductase] hydrolase